jgi:hypothetical protein
MLTFFYFIIIIIIIIIIMLGFELRVLYSLDKYIAIWAIFPARYSVFLRQGLAM